MAKIPSSIRIKRNIKYDIVYQDLIKDDPTCLGLCDPNTRMIHLKNGQSEKETFKTFTHELIHIGEFEYNIKISHKDVYKLENFIFNILKLNEFFSK